MRTERLPRLNDVIRAVAGVPNGNRLIAELSTLAAVNYAQELVSSGRWVIEVCGQCRCLIADCRCEPMHRKADPERQATGDIGDHKDKMS